jgi:hypothetical protein
MALQRSVYVPDMLSNADTDLLSGGRWHRAQARDSGKRFPWRPGD